MKRQKRVKRQNLVVFLGRRGNRVLAGGSEITLLWGLAPEINSLKNLDGMVVVEDNPGGWGLIQTEFLAGFVP